MEPSCKFLWKSIIYLGIFWMLWPLCFDLWHQGSSRDLPLTGYLYIKDRSPFLLRLMLNLSSSPHVEMHLISIMWLADHILGMAPICIQCLLSSSFPQMVVSFQPCFSPLFPHILLLFIFCFLAFYFMIFTTVCSWIAQITFTLSPSVHLQSICPSLLCP